MIYLAFGGFMIFMGLALVIKGIKDLFDKD